MTLKEELKLMINAHLPKAVWGEMERAKYYLTFPFATKSIDKKMAITAPLSNHNYLKQVYESTKPLFR